MKTVVRTLSLPWLSLLLAIAPANAGVEMPQKAISVEDGIVAVRAGVAPNPTAPASLPIGKLKYPTRYFVELINESPYPIWLDTAWTFPGGKNGKVSTSRAVKSSKGTPGRQLFFYNDKLGVIADQPILVEINVWSDEKRTTRIGTQTAEMRFAQPDIDVFQANFPSAFKSQPKDSPAVVISGWQDIPKPRTDVPGTETDPVLAADIQRLLLKTDSLQRFTCEREILGAEPIHVDESDVLSGMGEDALTKGHAEQEQGVFNVERWRVRSCGQDIVYEALLSAAEKGGTNVLVIDTANFTQGKAGIDAILPAIRSTH